MNRKFNKYVDRNILFAATLGAVAAPAYAEEPVTLKFADWMPVSH
ncbi:hypothetical protein [Seohaeicola zhoushanensis]|nr:hypothetical protein [Seohaeicola zhoushanensis]